MRQKKEKKNERKREREKEKWIEKFLHRVAFFLRKWSLKISGVPITLGMWIMCVRVYFEKKYPPETFRLGFCLRTFTVAWMKIMQRAFTVSLFI